MSDMQPGNSALGKRGPDDMLVAPMTPSGPGLGAPPPLQGMSMSPVTPSSIPMGLTSADEMRKQKARERQRRKRAKDRESAGLAPTTPHARATGTSSGVGRLREGETEEGKKARIREAARLRQQKHRAAVRQRRQQELDNPVQMPHDMYYGKMYDGPEANPNPYNAPSGAVFANTLLLALSCEPNLKYNLMRLYQLSEEEFPSLEQSLCMAFDHWNNVRYAASHAAHYGQMPNGPPPPPQHPEGGPPPEGHPTLDGRLTRIAPPSDDPSGSGSAPSSSRVPGWPANMLPVPGLPPPPGAIYAPQEGAIDPNAGAEGYFLGQQGQNMEPPHFRRRGNGASTGSAGPSGGPGGKKASTEDGDDDEGDMEMADEEGQGEAGEGGSSGPRGGEGAEHNKSGGEEEGDEAEAEQQRREHEHEHEQGEMMHDVEDHPLDPNEEHAKLWAALMEARAQAEAHARERAQAAGMVAPPGMGVGVPMMGGAGGVA